MACSDLKEDLEKKKEAYEDALQINENIVGIIESNEDEPKSLLRAKRAMLHCICKGMDAKEKQFRQNVHKLVRGDDDIPRHDDVYKFEEDTCNQESTDQVDSPQRDRSTENIDQESQGTAQTDRSTENTDQESQDTAQTDRSTENKDQEPQGTRDDFQYTIGQQRLAVYIGVGVFEKRASNGKSDGTGVYDDNMNREREENRDKSEAKRALQNLGFTFKSNTKEEISKRKVDEFIEKVFSDDLNQKVDVIVVLISSHGEEVIEQDEKRKDKNVLRHRIFLEDKYLYTDELLKRFDTSALKGIPKLFFIQACRSGFSAKEEDVVDPGADISVEVQGNPEKEKDLKASRSDGHKDISDARPRNLKPKATIAPQPQTEVANDTNVANIQTSIPHVKPLMDTPPEEDTALSSSDDIKHHEDVSDARPRNQTSGTAKNKIEPSKDISEITQSREIHKTNPQSATGEPIQNAGGAKPSDIADVRQPKPSVDITPQVIPQQETPSIMCIENSLVMFASAPGKEAYRRTSEGGWMMQSVTKELERWPSDPDLDLLQVLTRVIHDIAINNETDKGYKSAVCFTHMLTKDVYLCKRE